MRDEDKTQVQLMAEIEALRRRVAELEAKVAGEGQAEEALRDARQRFDLVAKYAADAIFIMDMNLNFTYVSPASERITGHTPEEAIRRTLDETLTPASIELAMKALGEELTIEEQPDKDLSRVRTLELEQIRKDGSTVWTETRMTFLRDRDGRPVGILGVSRDISERRRAEKEKTEMQAQLLHSQKMEAIGVLAGGVAHDFNNLLTTIHGYTELLMTGNRLDDSALQDLTEILRAAEQASTITRQLPMFSRRQPVDLTVVALNRTVKDLFRMLGRFIGEDITIETRLEPSPWSVQADAASIQQVVMNLAVNARDAMPRGGRLSITTENKRLDEAACKAIPGSRPGEFACLTIEDTGVGMSDETLQHVFEPFFTTKGPGKGTGLGLSVVYGIVNEHGGWINVTTAPGKGSAFRIYVPAFRGPENDERFMTPSLQDFRGDGQRILLVEDEPELRKLAIKSLSRNGYTVLATANAAEAMDLFEKEKGDFSLVFSDVVLPDKDGIQLTDNLRDLKPGLLVLLTSGYLDQKSQWAEIKQRGIPFLRKPYHLTDLLKAVKDTMGEGQPG